MNREWAQTIAPHTDKYYNIYLLESSLCHRCPDGFWSNHFHDGCLQMPEEFLAISDPLAIVLLTLSLIGVIVELLAAVVITKQKSSALKRNELLISVVLLFTLTGCFAASWAFVGKPTEVSCQCREEIVIFCLTLAMACVLNNIVLLFTTDDGLLLRCISFYCFASFSFL